MALRTSLFSAFWAGAACGLLYFVAQPVLAADRVAELGPEVERLETLEARLAAEAGIRTDDHGRLAEALEQRGEVLAARGRRLRALEKGSCR